MNPQDPQGGTGSIRGGDAQARQGPNGNMGVHGGYGHGHGPAMAPPPWGVPPIAPWFGPHPYPYANPYGPAFAAGFAPAGWGPGSAGWAPPATEQASTPTTLGLGLLNNRFVTGMLVGGALTYVLTNEAIQRAAIRGIMQVWLNVQGGIEETKERFRDAESEIKAGRHG
jgi:hypothetical protein